MQDTSLLSDRRRHNRTQGVLPVRVRGIDASGARFEEIAHTLDVTLSGARLGAIRRPLKALDRLVVLYRQRRIEFTVVWVRLLEGTKEYQVGLKALSEHQEVWGLSSAKVERASILVTG